MQSITLGIIILFVVVAFFFFHYMNLFSTAKTFIMVVLIVILVGSVVLWSVNNSDALSSTDTMISAVFGYFSWMKTTGNLVYDLGKEAVAGIGNSSKGNENKITDGRR